MRSFTTIGLISLLSAAAHGAQVDWTQFDFDPQHSGNNSFETMLNRYNVGTLHPLYHVTLPSIADGAPAFLRSVATPGGTKDLLFLTTKGGHLLAIDAQTGATVWSRRPATGPNYTTSSPTIDPNRQYIYGYGLDGKAHKYQVGDGTEILTGGWPQVATLKPDVEKGSSALAIATAGDGNTYLYVANGGYPGDAGDYQGHVTVINLATGAQVVFNTNCSDQSVHFHESSPPDCPQVQSAVWARPGVVYDAANDRIFFATGNGTYDANTGGFDWGDSLIGLSPTGTSAAGVPLDSYTPTEFQQLQNTDSDLGSAAPALLTAPPASLIAHLGVQSGKDAKLRLLNMDNMSGAGAPRHVAGELQKINVPQGGGVLTHPAVWVNPADASTWVFVANGNGISGLQLVVDGAGNPSLAARWTNSAGGTSPVIANGIIYYAGSGHVRALDPVTGFQLWSDASIGGIHWESPIVVNGRLFVTDENSMLWAYAPSATSATYVAIPPCRIVDTRLVGGPIAAGTSRQFLFYNAAPGFSWSTQGGAPGLANAACPGTTLTSAGGTLGNVAPNAAVATVTVVNTTAAGNLVVWGGALPVPNASALNWSNAGDVIANTTTIPWGGRTGQTQDFAVNYNSPNGQTNVVVDVVGYFIGNAATAMQCFTLSSAGSGTHTTGTRYTLNFPSCGTGYTATGNGCVHTGGLPANVYLQEISPTHGYCDWFNNSGSSVNASGYDAETVCCRVPGQ